MYITSTTATISGTPSTPSPTPLTGSMTVNIWCAGKAGVLTPGWSAPAAKLLNSAVLTVRGWNRGAIWEPGSAVGRPSDTQERPDGAKALYVVGASGYSQSYSVDSTLIEVSLSGYGTDEQGSGIVASAAVVWTRDPVVDYYNTQTASTNTPQWCLASYTPTFIDESPPGTYNWLVDENYSFQLHDGGGGPLRYFQNAWDDDLAAFGYLPDGARSYTIFRVREYWNDSGRYEVAQQPSGAHRSTLLHTFNGHHDLNSYYTVGACDPDFPSGDWSIPGYAQAIDLGTSQIGPNLELNASSTRETYYELRTGNTLVDQVVEQRNLSGYLSAPVTTGFHGEWAVGIRYSNNVVGLLELNTDSGYYGFSTRVRNRYGPDGSVSGPMYPGMSLESITPAEEALYYARTKSLSSNSVICASWNPRAALVKTWTGGSVGTFI